MKNPEKKAHSINYMKRKETVFIWAMLALPLISWIIWYWYVNLSSILNAFKDTAGNWSFINFEMYWESLTAPSTDLGSISVGLKNTFGYYLQDLLLFFPLQILLAYFLYKRIPGFKFFRVIFYLPSNISGVAMTSVFKAMIATDGPLGVILEAMGTPLEHGLLSVPSTATKTIMVYKLWVCLASRMLLLGGALARIPIEVLESAKLDGVGPGRELINMIIPLISSTLITYLILGTTGIIGASGPILLLAPDHQSLGTTTLSYWIFDKVYAKGVHMAGQYNLVSATGLAFTVVLVPFVLTVRWLLEKIDVVEY